MKSNKSKVFLVGITLLMLSAFSIVLYADESADDATVINNGGADQGVVDNPTNAKSVDKTPDTIDGSSALSEDTSSPDPTTPSTSDNPATPVDSGSDKSSEPVIPENAAATTTSASDNLYYKLSSVSSPKGPFGEMSSSFQTSMFTGSATYVYPLTLPKGTNGLTPEVLLSYDSGSANGRASITGLGWDLGLSYIERDVNYTPDNLNDDKFILVLGGQRNDLVYVSGDNRFHTKIESYLYVNKSSGGSNLKGEYWIARTKDGTEYQFGYYSGSGYNSEALCSNGIYVNRWYLDQVKDTHNNTIFFYYAQNVSTRDVGAVYPSKIIYNGPIASGNKTIDFILENTDRPDIPIVYEQGCRIAESRRIGEIKISFNNTLIRKYLLKYSLNYANSKSILSSITECGNDNTSCLPSTSFENVKSDHQFDTSGVTWSFPSSLGSSYPRLITTIIVPDVRTYSESTRDVFDINGDGLPELVDVPASGSYWDVFQNLGNGFNTFSVRWSTPGNVFIRYQNTSRGDTTADTFDINGDGLPDYITVANGHWEVYYNNGTGFSGTSFNWSTPGTILIRDISSNYDTTSDTFDINGDGLPDYVRTATNHWDVYFNTRSGFNTTAYNWSFPNSASNIRVANGEGDIENDTFDINGDGLPDYVTKKSDHWNVYLNNGTGFNASALYWSFPSATATTTDIRQVDSDGSVGSDTIDMNGDGLPDYVDTRGTHWDVYFNNGSGFNITAYDWPIPSVDNSHMRLTGTTGDNPQYLHISQDTFDVNGDGLPDYVDHYQDANWKVYLNTVKSPDRLGKITNSLGGNTTINYIPSTRFNNKGSDNVSDLGFPMWVVSSVVENNSMNALHNVLSVTNYSYSGGFYSYNDREFRGFEYVNVTNSLGNVDSYRFYQDDSKKGKLRSVYSFDKNGAYYSGTENNWTNSTKSGGYYEVLLSGTTDYSFDGSSANPKSSAVQYSYDSYGNLVKVSYLGSNISGDERYAATTYIVNTDKWIVNTASNNSLSDSGNNVLTRTEYYYDNSTSLTTAPVLGDVTKERHLVNGTYVESLYGYYSNGVLRNSTDPEGRVSYLEYDNTYTFPKRTVNAKGQSTNYTYDPGTGNLLNLTDPNGFMTYYLYDVFGRVVKEVRPSDSVSNPTILYNYSRDGIAPESVKVSKKTDSDTLEVYQFVDGFGRLIQTRRESEDSSRQIVENILYDSLGRVEKQLIPYNETSSTSYASPQAGIKYVQYSYDPLGRVNKTTNTDGNYSTGSYDHWNITVKDDNGHQKNYYLDAYKRVYTVEERNSGEIYSTTYNYSAKDELVKITDSKGNVFSFGFDELGRKINMTDPDMGSWLYTYDKVGNLRTQRDNRNNLTIFGYDVLNRVTSVNYSDGKKIVYVYDKDSPYSDGVLGTLAYVSEAGDRSTRYYYDTRLRNVKEVRTIAGNTWAMNWTYDPADRINSTKYPENSLYSFGYNLQGTLNNISNAISNIDYNSQDKVITKQFPNGVNTTFIYDPNSFRLSGIWTQKSTTYQSLNFTYDNVGNIKTITDEGATQNFAYDDLDRLTIAYEPSGYVHVYDYDSIGNMIAMSDGGDVTTFSYGAGAGPHAMTGRNWSTSTIKLSFNPPTEVNGTTVNRDWALVNVSANLSQGALNIFKLNWNGTDYVFYNSSLVLAYSFNNYAAIGENSTRIIDISQYGNNGSCSGSTCPVWNSSGKFNGAYTFDGADDYLSGGLDGFPDANTPRTVEAWVYTKDRSNYRTIICYGTCSSGHGFHLVTEVTSGKLLISTYGVLIGPSDDAVPLNAWTHVAASFDGSTVKYYINGVNSGTFSAYFSTALGSLRIGKSLTGWDGADGNYVLNGSLDELRVYKRALSGDEILMHYNSEIQKYSPMQYMFYDNITNLKNGLLPYYGWGSDTSGNSGQTDNGSLRYLNVDVHQDIEFTPPTESNGTTLNRSWTAVNVSIKYPLDSFRLNWNNVNYTLFNGSLVMAYNFNNNSAIGENSTRFIDISRQGNNGSCSGATCPVWSASGHFGGAYQFDGSDDYVSGSLSGFPSGNSPRTVEAWIYTKDRSNYRTVICYGSCSAGQGFHFVTWLTTGKLYVSNYGGLIGPSNDVVPLNTWTHVAVSYDGSTMTFYVNGVSSGSFSTSLSTSTGSLRVGKSIAGWDGADGNYVLNGSIDELRVYSWRLSPEEIWVHYNSELLKYNATWFRFYDNVTSLSTGTHSYYAWANDSSGNKAQTDNGYLRYYTYQGGATTTTTTTTTTGATTTTFAECDIWAYDTSPQNCYIDLVEVVNAINDWSNGLLSLDCVNEINNAWHEDIRNPDCSDKSFRESHPIPEADRTFAVSLLYPADGKDMFNNNPAFSFKVSGYTFLYNCSLFVNGSLIADTWALNNTDQSFKLSKDLGVGLKYWAVNCSDYSPRRNMSSVRKVLIRSAAAISIPSTTTLTTSKPSTTMPSFTSVRGTSTPQTTFMANLSAITSTTMPASENTLNASTFATTTTMSEMTTMSETTTSVITTTPETTSMTTSSAITSTTTPTYTSFTSTTTSAESTYTSLTTASTMRSAVCWDESNKYLYVGSEQYSKFCMCVSGEYGFSGYDRLSGTNQAYGYVDSSDSSDWSVANMSFDEPVYRVRCNASWYLTNKTYEVAQ